MKQLIDKSELLAELADMDAHFDHNEQLIINFDEVVDMIEEMKPENEWHKTIPEFDVPVLVSNGKRVWPDRLILTEDGELRYEDSGVSIPGTRWMPFPEPYADDCISG